MLARGEVEDDAVRVDPVAFVEPAGHLVDLGSVFRPSDDADVISLHGAHGHLWHSVRL